MTFDEILAQVLDLLQREKRLSYRALKVRFGLDDEHLAALKAAWAPCTLNWDSRRPPALPSPPPSMTYTGAMDMTFWLPREAEAMLARVKE